MKRISKKDIARHLRQEQTPAEEFLWEVLRNRQFEDLKFRRQHPIKNYIVDFCCLEIMLIVELDGGYHNTIDQKEKDELRDIHLRQLGYRVLRYKNNIALNNHTIILNDISIRNKEQTPSPLKEKAGMRSGFESRSMKSFVGETRSNGSASIQLSRLQIHFLPAEITCLWRDHRWKE